MYVFFVGWFGFKKKEKKKKDCSYLFPILYASFLPKGLGKLMGQFCYIVVSLLDFMGN